MSPLAGVPPPTLFLPPRLLTLSTDTLAFPKVILRLSFPPSSHLSRLISSSHSFIHSFSRSFTDLIFTLTMLTGTLLQAEDEQAGI